MMERNEFDELARRKLEEREFPFQEGAWQAMENLLDTRTRPRGLGTGWTLSALALLLAGAAAGYLALQQPGAQERLAEQAGTEQAGHGTHGGPSTEAHFIPFAGTAASPGVPATTGDRITPRAVPPSAVVAEAIERVQATPQNTQGSASYASAPSPLPGPTPQPPSAPAGSSSAITSAEASSTFLDFTQEQETRMALVPSAAAVPNGPHHQEDPMMLPDPADERPAISLHPSGEAGEESDMDGMSSASIPPTLQEMDAHSQVVTAPSVPQQPDGLEEMEGFALAELMNGDGAGVEAGVQDSAGAVVAMPAPPTLVPPGAPLELAAFLCMQNSTTTYSGEATQDWGHSMQAARSYSAGLELLRMGRNFGFGAGLHVSDYSERIRTNAVDRSRTELNPYYFMRPVDTALLLITDTVFVGGVAQYTGQTVYTTVFVLDQAVDTVTVTERLREARDQVNRTLYVEIPLLVDAHLVQGRWNLGVRGGPTAALLNRRRGLLPDAGETGYTDLASRDMNTLVLGYTARAYVRYRFSAGWSVGLEPMLRGHLTNGMADDALTRRPRAWGMAFGLTYRFR
jgi:hypothetical protein